MLFINKWNPSSILLRIWEHCATNCYNCYSRYDKKNNYKYNDFSEVFKFMKDKCDKSFSVFLFWTEVIFHPEIEKFIEDKTIMLFRHSLHINPIYSILRADKMLSLYNKYNYIYFDTCYFMKNVDEIKGVFKTILFLKKHQINSSMDLFVDLWKFWKIIKIFFKEQGFMFNKQERTSHLNFPDCLEFTINNKKLAIMIYHTKKQEIRNKTITNIPNTWCVVRKTFDIDDNKILVNEEIELDYKWVIKMHINTYCNKAIKQISHINKSNIEIKNDFKKLDEYLVQYDNDDMWKDCFRCVSNPYINNT